MARYIWYALAYLVGASHDWKADEMKYLASFMIAILFAAFWYLVCGYTFMIADDC